MFISQIKPEPNTTPSNLSHVTDTTSDNDSLSDDDSPKRRRDLTRRPSYHRILKDITGPDIAGNHFKCKKNLFLFFYAFYFYICNCLPTKKKHHVDLINKHFLHSHYYFSFTTIDCITNRWRTRRRWPNTNRKWWNYCAICNTKSRWTILRTS